MRLSRKLVSLPFFGTWTSAAHVASSHLFFATRRFGTSHERGNATAVVTGAWGTTALSRTSEPLRCADTVDGKLASFHAPASRCSELPATPPGTATDAPQAKKSAERLSKKEILSLVEAFVPTVLTSVSQVARRVPDSLMEELCNLPEGNAGLAGYLACHPRHFAATRIGKVVVARRLRAQTALSMTQATSRLRDVVVKHSSTQLTNASSSISGNDVTHAWQACQPVPQQVFDVIPPFLVPVEALLSPPSSTTQDVRSFLQRHQRFLHYVHPFADDALSPHNTTTQWTRGYVSLHPLYRNVNLQAPPAAQERVAAAAALPEPCAPAQRLADYEVQDYEWYRVARLFPSANTEVCMDSVMMTNAQQLLPPGRSVLHVLYSAPHLFYVRSEQPGCERTGDENAQMPGPSAAVVEEGRVVVYCQFVLDPLYSVKVSESKEELLQTLEQIQTPAPDSNSGYRRPINRTKRRSVRRKLQYLSNRTPYFDERVLAIQLLDLMPAEDSVSVADLVASLPGEARNCLPANLRAIFSRFPEYFVYFYDGISNGAMVQRADLPPPSVRHVESISAEEIIQEVFTRYPLRSRPEDGTCFYQCMNVLPSPYRKRLGQLRDVREEVLLRVPDKVEVLPTPVPLMKPDPPPASSAVRKDFLVRFRFVGEWQERLMQRYEKHWAK